LGVSIAPPIIDRESQIVNNKLQRVDIMKLLRIVILLVVSTMVTGLEAQDTLAFDIRSAYSVPELQKLTRTDVFSRAGAGSLTVADEVAFAQPQSFETALITLGQWTQTGPQTLRIEDGPAALHVQIDTGGLAFQIVPTEINEHVHTKKLPTRLAITLEASVQQAIVTMKITPAD